jgi:hypothetical protein
MNFREYETLYPLSSKAGIPIETVTPDTLPHLYLDTLQSGQLCGKVTVVSWKHSYIVELAHNLGCTEDDGCPTLYPETNFDQVWQLKYVFYPTTTTTLPDSSYLQHHNKSTTGGTSTSTPSSGTTTDVEDMNNRRRHTRLLLQQQSRQTSSSGTTTTSSIGWKVYGTVSQQNFDPLSFSYQMGDYPAGGTPVAGRWRQETTVQDGEF